MYSEAELQKEQRDLLEAETEISTPYYHGSVYKVGHGPLVFLILTYRQVS